MGSASAGESGKQTEMTELNHTRRRWLLLLVLAIDGNGARAASAETGVAAGAPGLEVVTVTAQKRAENLQATPIAIFTISGATLAQRPGISTADLARYVPGLLVGKSTFVGQTYLRGVGQSNGVPGVESPVATYLDGVYLGAPALAVFDLNNISQVAVLRGPQGTLFGRNATGGLIQVTTREASHDFDGNAEVGYGNFNTVSGRLYATGEVSANLAASVAFSGSDRQDGYIRNTITDADLLDEKKYTLQNKWLLDLGEYTTVKLNLLHGDYRNVSGTQRGIYPGTLASDGVSSYLGEHRIANRIDGSNATQIDLASVTLASDRDWGRISNQASFVGFRGELAVDQSGHPGRPNPNNVAAQISALDATIESWTEEFQVQAAPGAELQWIAGIFYLHDVTDIALDVDLDAAPFSFVSTELQTDSWSLFAQATRPLTERARVTAGLRYTRDTKDFSGSTATGARPASTLPTHQSWSQPTWRLALDYQFTPAVLGYVSYNRGFKSGAYTNTDVVFPPAAPETVDAYELGLKSQWLDNRLRLNGAAFFYDYTDLQLRAVSGAVILTYNAANSRVYGLDIELDALFTDDFSVSAGFEALHARYTHFPTGPVSLPTPLPAVPPGCTGTPNLRNGGATTVFCDLAGNAMVKAPKLSATFGMHYEMSFAGGTAVLSLQDRYSSRYYFEPDNVLEQSAYHWVDATLSLAPDDGAWRLSLWGTNLTGARVFDAAVTAGNSFVYSPGSPRMYGLTLNLRF
jgi:iron complex outermembrane receptor protein